MSTHLGLFYPERLGNHSLYVHIYIFAKFSFFLFLHMVPLNTNIFLNKSFNHSGSNVNENVLYIAQSIIGASLPNWVLGNTKDTSF